MLNWLAGEPYDLGPGIRGDERGSMYPGQEA